MDVSCIHTKVLDELHLSLLGLVKFKAITRSFVYLNSIDKDIDEDVRNCADCTRHKADTARSKVHYWKYPSKLGAYAY